MAIPECGTAPPDARRLLALLLQRCEPIGQRSDAAAVAWSLTGINRLLSEGAAPLRLSDCLIVAGVIAHLIESTIERDERVGPVSTDLVTAHREALAFMESCAWAAASAAPRTEAADPRADRALRYLRDHFRQPDLDAGAIARHVGLSRHYLARLLLRSTGRSLHAHLHDVRIREARRLLLVTTLSVKEIGASVGYPDAAQFCRQFRRLSKSTPGAFRRAARHAAR